MTLQLKKILQDPNEYSFRFKSEALRALVDKTTNSLKLLSDLKADLNHAHTLNRRIKRPVRRLIDESLLMAQELNIITNNKHQTLYNAIYRIKSGTENLFQKEDRPDVSIGVKLDDPDASNSIVTGEKGSGLALLQKKFENSIPGGFIITTKGYSLFLDSKQLNEKIRLLHADIDGPEDYEQVASGAEKIRKLIQYSDLPSEIEETVFELAGDITNNTETRWAVRTSSVDETGEHNFAGQYTNFTNVETKDLGKAYKEIIAGRFSASASMYRAISGFREVKTPVAVLFMPMIDSLQLKGNALTRDINNPHDDNILVNQYEGKLFDQKNVYKFYGEQNSDSTVTLNTKETLPPEIDQVIREIAQKVWVAKKEFGFDLDIDWAVDSEGKIYFLQCRKMQPAVSDQGYAETDSPKDAAVSGGITIFPGRAVGHLIYLKSEEDIHKVRKGSIIIADNAEEFLVPVLPIAAAVILINGEIGDPVLSLIRELSIPGIYQVGDKAGDIINKHFVSIDATNRSVYSGFRWEGIRERVMTRIDNRTKQKGSSKLYRYILDLNLKNPDSPTFKAKLCGSVHDVIWYIQEMAARAMFSYGDMHKKQTGIHTFKMKSTVPIEFQVINIDQITNTESNKIEPERIDSAPFQALWRGIADPELFWPHRWERRMVDMPDTFSEVALGGVNGPRRKKDPNYFLITEDYVNMNARISYHYIMVDAVARYGSGKNHIHFRFRDGGGNFKSRELCACFLEKVLLGSGFGTDRNGDIISAWYRFYPEEMTVSKLEMLGRLIVCARELDAVLNNEGDVKTYADSFLQGKYGIFS